MSLMVVSNHGYAQNGWLFLTRANDFRWSELEFIIERLFGSLVRIVTAVRYDISGAH